MVRVDTTTSDSVTAWRIRDALASHPILGGGAADIYIIADHGKVVLEGWTMDRSVHDLAIRLATRAVGRRALSTKLSIRNCRDIHLVPRFC